MKQGHNVPIKYGGTFFKKIFIAVGGQFTGGLFYMEDSDKIYNDQIMPRGSFTNTFFSSNFSFFQSGRDIHLNINP